MLPTVIDFSLDKSTTVTRRIERRLLLTHSLDCGVHVEQIEANSRQ
jgi:hypothetical protein